MIKRGQEKRKTLQESNTRIKIWKIITKLEDLNFADDIGRISSSKQRIQTKTDKLTQKAGKLE